jgi:hypothetical protein
MSENTSEATTLTLSPVERLLALEEIKAVLRFPPLGGQLDVPPV